ncbi:MAG TPA: DUF11 domain-containing protein [Thermoanaerobaculia bacterium]|nr:DUF11 domain-containing protein [Thermoanaerobaculia bacterium]
MFIPARTARAEDAEVALNVNGTLASTAGSTLDILGSYTISGPGAITDFHLRIDLPAHTALKEFEYPPVGLSCSHPSSSVIDCSAPSSSGLNSFTYFELLVSIDADAVPDTPLPFTFTILGNGITTPLADRTKTFTTYVLGPNDPATSISAPRSVDAGNALPATATVTNNGPYDVHGAYVFFTMWNGLTPVDIPNVSGPNGWRWIGDSKTTTASCYADIILPGTVAVFTFSGVLPQGATGSVRTMSSISSPFDISQLNNDVVATSFIGTPPPSADVSVTISASPAQANPGDQVTYTVRLDNTSSVAATGVALSVGDSASLPVVSSTLPCSSGPCDMGTIIPGESRTFTVVVRASTPSGATVTATATTSATNDDTPVNNHATANFGIGAPANPNPNVDLSLTMSTAPADVHPGDLITFIYVVTNHGGATATGVVVHPVLPANMKFVSDSGEVIGTLAAGQSAIVTVTAVATMLGSDTASAQVVSTETDSNPGDNSASETIAVTPLSSSRRRSSHH